MLTVQDLKLKWLELEFKSIYIILTMEEMSHRSFSTEYIEWSVNCTDSHCGMFGDHLTCDCCQMCKTVNFSYELSLWENPWTLLSVWILCLVSLTGAYLGEGMNVQKPSIQMYWNAKKTTCLFVKNTKFYSHCGGNWFGTMWVVIGGERVKECLGVHQWINLLEKQAFTLVIGKMCHGCRN